MRWTVRFAGLAALMAAAPVSSQQQEQEGGVNPVQGMAVQSSAEKPSEGVNQKNSAGGDKLGVDKQQQTSAPEAPQVVYPQVESVMEGGVQVVRRSSGIGAVVAQGDANQAGGPQGAISPEVRRGACPLARVRIADNWKYAKPHRTAETQRAQLWEYKERRHRTYQPKPQRSADEVARLTRYRRTQD